MYFTLNSNIVLCYSLYLTPDLVKYDEISLNVNRIFCNFWYLFLAAFHARLDLCAKHHIVSRGATGLLNFSNI